MVLQSCIDFPMHSAVLADPQARRINACVNGSSFIRTTRHNGPDIFKFLLASFRELDTDFRIMPCLSKIIAIAQKCSKKVSIIGCEYPLAVALIESCKENTTPLQRCRFYFPDFSIP